MASTMCSLEDDDCASLFITQEPCESVPLMPNMGDESDQAWVVGDPHYSDISDADDFEIPSSQVQGKGIG